MKIKFIALKMLSQDYQSITKSIDVVPNENIIHVCHQIGNLGMIITFGSYYLRFKEMMSSNNCFPFIIRNDFIKWNVEYSEVGVSQIIYTRILKDFEIILEKIQ